MQLAPSYLASQLARMTPEQLRIQRHHRLVCERQQMLKEWIELRQGDVESHYLELHALRETKSKLAQKMFQQERIAA